ncbi:hypothetical protein B0H19DRAFT_71994 [Mycena capillaripes]|nr:hypothetical protein B0H19DRAFT_71994 [Mycena capillaripes]
MMEDRFEARDLYKAVVTRVWNAAPLYLRLATTGPVVLLSSSFFPLFFLLSFSRAWLARMLMYWCACLHNPSQFNADFCPSLPVRCWQFCAEPCPFQVPERSPSTSTHGENNGLRFSADDTESTIMGLTTARFIATMVCLVLAILGFLLWLWYRRRKARATRVPDQEAYSFKAGAWMPATYVAPPIPPASTRPPPPTQPEPLPEPVPAPAPAHPTRSISMLKREQTDALPHYDDTHTAPDVLLQTSNGLQLLPGAPAPVPKKKGYRPFWRQTDNSGK